MAGETEFAELAKLFGSDAATREAYRAAASAATKAAVTGGLESAASGGIGSFIGSAFNPVSALYSVYNIIKMLGDRKDAREAAEEAERARYLQAKEELAQQGFDIDAIYAPSVFDVSQYEDLMGLPTSMSPEQMSNYAKEAVLREYINNINQTGGGSTTSEQVQSAVPSGYIKDAGGFYRNTNNPLDYGYYILDKSGKPFLNTPPLIPIPKPTNQSGTPGGGGGSSSSAGSTASSGGASAGALPSDYTGPAQAQVGTGDATDVLIGQIYDAIGYETDPEVKAGLIRDYETYTGKPYNPAEKPVVGDQTYSPERPATVATNGTTSVGANSSASVPDWVQIAYDWLKKYPNATEEEKRTAAATANMPSDILEQVLKDTGVGPTGTGTTGTGTTTGTSPTGTDNTGTGTGTGTGNNGGTGPGEGPGSGPGSGGGTGGGTGSGTPKPSASLAYDMLVPQYRTVTTTPADLARIDYLYDVGGESIFAPMREQESEEDKRLARIRDLQRGSYAQGGPVDIVGLALQLLRG